ncbi:hypothetical protein CDAR_556931 [Caerostris darwini]|uniref:Uncharacterized protein n=1 Tax=Caerostris darwini TaxID=1538125 RepID=A0AAV4QF60_9ARAC|nr:hypothetical protein CDAR_556931 [Caerostris darwini]
MSRYKKIYCQPPEVRRASNKRDKSRFTTGEKRISLKSQYPFTFQTIEAQLDYPCHKHYHRGTRTLQ